MSLPTLILDLQKVSSFNPARLILREGETGIIQNVELGDGFLEKDITNSQLEFRCKKPDGTIIADTDQSHFINRNKNRFSYQLSDQMFTSYGLIKEAYFLVDGDSTANFWYFVSSGVTGEGSGSYVTKIEDLYEQALSVLEGIQGLNDLLQDEFDDFLSEKETDFTQFKTQIEQSMDSLKISIGESDKHVESLETKIADFTQTVNQAIDEFQSINPELFARKTDVYDKTETMSSTEINIAIESSEKIKTATVNGGQPISPDENGNLPLIVPEPDLSPYETKDNASKTYQQKGNYALKSDLSITDTGWQTTGVTLLNGAQNYGTSNIASYRIITLLGVMFVRVKGILKGITTTGKNYVQYDNLPSLGNPLYDAMPMTGSGMARWKFDGVFLWLENATTTPGETNWLPYDFDYISYDSNLTRKNIIATEE